MNTTTLLMKFDMISESEKRFTISSQSFREAVKQGLIKIYKRMEIEQIWFVNDKRCSGRIRKTTLFSEGKNAVSYEHTVKHHFENCLDYEVNTTLEDSQYSRLKDCYKDKKVQSKLRFYVYDKTDPNLENYIITVDLPDDNKEICWVEIESNKENVEKHPFKRPSWIKPIKG